MLLVCCIAVVGLSSIVQDIDPSIPIPQIKRASTKISTTMSLNVTGELCCSYRQVIQ